MENIYDVLIIGGGPAGYSAALYAARAGLKTAVLEKMSAGGQMALTDTIDNYPGFEEGVEGFALGFKMQTQAERFGAQSLYGTVESVDLVASPKKIVADSGEYFAKSVLIATGADPQKLGLENEDAYTGMGIHYCAHCDGRFYKDKTVVVVGGGNSAAQDALYLSRLAKKVYLVHRRDTLRATKIYHEPLMKAENVEFLWNSAVTALHSEKRLNAVTVRDLQGGEEKTIEADGLFVSIGREPASEIFKEVLLLNGAGYIVADETTKTNIEGVFAAGDVREKALRQVITAASDGAVSAHYAEEYIRANF